MTKKKSPSLKNEGHMTELEQKMQTSPSNLPKFNKSQREQMEQEALAHAVDKKTVSIDPEPGFSSRLGEKHYTMNKRDILDTMNKRDILDFMGNRPSFRGKNTGLTEIHTEFRLIFNAVTQEDLKIIIITTKNNDEPYQTIVREDSPEMRDYIVNLLNKVGPT